jgi:hypothetical protein
MVVLLGANGQSSKIIETCDGPRNRAVALEQLLISGHAGAHPFEQ